jgi:GMP synthase-like glutamine amidotransferase
MNGAGGSIIPEWGTFKIDVKRKDPIFDGLPKTSYFHAFESHNYSVERAGKMQILASSEKVETQVVRYKGKPWYSFQARIEEGWEDSCPEAYLLWKNMFKIWRLLSDRSLARHRRS